MLEVIKKLDSATIRGLIVATVPLLVLIASFFGIDEAIFQAKLEGIGEKLVALVSLLGVAWAAYARIFQPTPPLSESAQIKTAEMLAAGKLAEVAPPPTPSQKGFARPLMLAFVLAIGVIGTVVASGCTSTRAALSNADTPSDFALVFLEGYDAALVTANALKKSNVLSGENLIRVQQAEAKAWPLVRQIDPLRKAYEETQSAEDAAALQRAIDNAIREAAEFIRIVRELRSQT
jgi:hypothetical protein